MTEELQTENCVQIEGKCKFCGITLKPWIDKDYQSLGDPLKLIELLCCDRCADLRTAKRRIEDSIRMVVVSLVRLRFEKRDKAEADMLGISESLRSLCRKFSEWVALDQKLPFSPPSADLAEIIIKDPAPALNWWKHLRDFARFHRRAQT